jgi:hypothetical protein
LLVFVVFSGSVKIAQEKTWWTKTQDKPRKSRCICKNFC